METVNKIHIIFIIHVCTYSGYMYQISVLRQGHVTGWKIAGQVLTCIWRVGHKPGNKIGTTYNKVSSKVLTKRVST